MPLILRHVKGDIWQIYAMCDADGRTFLDHLELSESEEARVAANLDRLATLGPNAFPTDRMHLVDTANRLFQLRVGDCRIMWFYDAGKVIVCCHGYRKKSQKIPPGDRLRGAEAVAEYQSAKQFGQVEIRKEDD